MRRGEIWTVAGGKDYAGKPRPVVIVQDDNFDATDSITVCAFTTDPTDAPLICLAVEPNERNGLRSPCRLMIDKLADCRKASPFTCLCRRECATTRNTSLDHLDRVRLAPSFRNDFRLRFATSLGAFRSSSRKRRRSSGRRLRACRARDHWSRKCSRCATFSRNGATLAPLPPSSAATSVAPMASAARRTGSASR